MLASKVILLESYMLKLNLGEITREEYDIKVGIVMEEERKHLERINEILYSQTSQVSI